MLSSGRFAIFFVYLSALVPVDRATSMGAVLYWKQGLGLFDLQHRIANELTDQSITNVIEHRLDADGTS